MVKVGRSDSGSGVHHVLQGLGPGPTRESVLLAVLPAGLAHVGVLCWAGMAGAFWLWIQNLRGALQSCRFHTGLGVGIRFH
jgi:hypothetical protein